MAYQIPRPGMVIPQERARTPRFFDAALAQQAQANALRQKKEQEKANNLAAAVSLIGSAGGEGGWLQALGFGAEEAIDDTMAQEGNQALPEGQMLADDGMSDTEKASAAMSVASLAGGNPMGLIGLKKLFDEYAS